MSTLAASNAWSRITPRPRSRNLIVGSVGSGKSTVGASLLESYHSDHPGHRIYLVDPKHRFVPVQAKTGRVFPEGTTARNHGRVDGVSVNARLLRDVDGYRWENDRIFLVQDHAKTLELYSYLFEHADVRQPVMVYNDESFDMHRAGQVDWRFRRLVQMGREKGIGHITVNQRPKRIDVTLISESERLYVGTLHNVNDRKALADTVSVPNAKELLVPMPQHVFWMIDQSRPENSVKFRITGAE